MSTYGETGNRTGRDFSTTGSARRDTVETKPAFKTTELAVWALTVIGVLATLAGATAAACYVPGRRALRIEPAAALRRD